MIAKCNTCPYDKQECFSRACGVNLEVCIKRYAEENYPVAMRLNDEIKSLRYDLLHAIAERDAIERENADLKIEMHFMKQRMNEDDFQYVQDCMYNETRKDDFDQRLP